jgi:hypothetical protein
MPKKPGLNIILLENARLGMGLRRINGPSANVIVASDGPNSSPNPIKAVA